MDFIPHATRTSLRRLLLRKGIEVPPIRDITLSFRTCYHVWYPTYFLLWRDSRGKHHRADYYLNNGEPHLRVDGNDLPVTMAEVEHYGLYREKE